VDEPQRNVVLAVSPHLDDAVLSAGVTLAAMAAEGSRVVVCTVFSGIPKPSFSALAEDFHAACGLGADAVVVRQAEAHRPLARLDGHFANLTAHCPSLRVGGPHHRSLLLRSGSRD